MRDAQGALVRCVTGKAPTTSIHCQETADTQGVNTNYNTLLLVTGGTQRAEKHCTVELLSFLYILFKHASGVLTKDDPVKLKL